MTFDGQKVMLIHFSSYFKNPTLLTATSAISKLFSSSDCVPQVLHKNTIQM